MKDLGRYFIHYDIVSLFATIVSAFCSILIAKIINIISPPNIAAMMDIFTLFVLLPFIVTFTFPCALIGTAILMLLSLEYPRSNSLFSWMIFGGFAALMFLLYTGLWMPRLIIIAILAGLAGGCSGNAMWRFIRRSKNTQLER